MYIPLVVCSRFLDHPSHQDKIGGTHQNPFSPRAQNWACTYACHCNKVQDARWWKQSCMCRLLEWTLESVPVTRLLVVHRFWTNQNEVSPEVQCVIQHGGEWMIRFEDQNKFLQNRVPWGLGRLHIHALTLRGLSRLQLVWEKIPRSRDHSIWSKMPTQEQPVHFMFLFTIFYSMFSL